MAIDPASVAAGAAIGSAVGGVTSHLIKAGWDSGVQWLEEKFRGHQAEARRKAEQNALVFLGDLATRVKDIEEDIAKTAEGQQKITAAFEDPDFSAVFQSALLTSARTSSKEKHELLARALADRLRADPDSLTSLATSLAVETIGKLAPDHLRILGLTAFILGTRPGNVANLSGEEYETWVRRGVQELGPLPSFGLSDLTHLVSVSCAAYNSFVTQGDFFKVLAPKEKGDFTWSDDFKSDAVIQEAARLWAEHLLHLTLTSVGLLIGVYVIERHWGRAITLRW